MATVVYAVVGAINRPGKVKNEQTGTATALDTLVSAYSLYGVSSTALQSEALWDNLSGGLEAQDVQGSEFVGWYTTPSNYSWAYPSASDATTLLSASRQISRATVLSAARSDWGQSTWFICYPKYISTARTITFNANGGSGTMAAVNTYKGATVTLPTCTFTRSGYKFSAWAWTGGVYADGASVTVTDSLTLYAIWEGVEYCYVSFDPNGGTMTPVLAKVERGKALSTALNALPTATRTGYTFSAWKYSGGSTSVRLADIITADRVALATWAQTPAPSSGPILYSDSTGLILWDD